ncbi:MAG: hypothetical protein AAF330_00380 [Pseudomonadota bacterium]
MVLVVGMTYANWRLGKQGLRWLFWGTAALNILAFIAMGFVSFWAALPQLVPLLW